MYTDNRPTLNMTNLNTAHGRKVRSRLYHVVEDDFAAVVCNCYSECISTPGKLEKYAWPRWDSNLRPLEC